MERSGPSSRFPRPSESPRGKQQLHVPPFEQSFSIDSTENSKLKTDRKPVEGRGPSSCGENKEKECW